MASIFNFVEKEGKYFTPIANTAPAYEIVNGTVVRSTNDKIVSGIKGVYAQVRITLPAANAGSKSELFALNTEMMISSN